jgi:hypothetical protein
LEGLSPQFEYTKTCPENIENLNKIISTLLDLKMQVDSLAGMGLQNRCALEITTASQGRTRTMLERLLLWGNKNNINQILEKARDIRERATKGWLSWEGTWSFLSHGCLSFLDPCL